MQATRMRTAPTLPNSGEVAKKAKKTGVTKTAKGRAAKPAAQAGPAPATTIAGLTLHPCRSLLEPPSVEFVKELAVMIKQFGLKMPVVLANGLLIDGWARAVAWEVENPGKAVPTVSQRIPDPATYILTTWIHEKRTGAQKALAAARLLPHFEKEAKARQRQAGGAHPQKVPGAGEAAEHAATAVGTNSEYVRKAKKLLQDTPEVAAEIDAGRIQTIPEAERLSKMEKRKRKSLIRQLRTGVSIDELLPAEKPLKTKSDRWLTPPYIIRAVQAALGGTIALDPATEPDNPTKAKEFCYGGHSDGLKRAWLDGTFCNPPFSDADTWMRKALDEHRAGLQRGEDAKRIFLLLPVHTDSSLQQEVMTHALDILLLNGRIAFGDANPKAEVEDGNTPAVTWDKSGKNAHMILGFGVSVMDLQAAGLHGILVRPDRTAPELDADQLAFLANMEPWNGPTESDIALGKQFAKDAAREETRLANARKQVDGIRPQRRSKK